MTFPLVAGGVYYIADKDLVLPPEEERKLHPMRPVLVVSSPVSIHDGSWRFVAVVPLSSEPQRATRFCVAIKKGEGNLDRDTFARVPAVQPLMKDALGRYLGTLPPNRLEEVRANLATYL